ncbi:MAG: sugar ABC transporter permease [Clostridiales bacterium]|jgi:raffinose/stachyose/melibiose transport system permease protein|nr:sugar ABC transporter permease [Clostridiales bacterium]
MGLALGLEMGWEMGAGRWDSLGLEMGWERRALLMILKSKRYAALFLFPALAFILIFLIIPLFRTIYYSLTKWYNFSPRQEFILFKNYQDIFSDRIVHIALKNTGAMIVGVLLFQIVLALALAICADSASHGFRFFRTVFFFPIVISATAIGLMFSLIYKYDYGLLNYLMELLGLERRVWLTKESALFMVLIPICWQYVGFYFVIFLTGIAKIPEDIYESARLDGIRPLQKVLYITIPMLKDIIVSNLVLVVSGCFRVFDMIYIVTGGGPLNASELLSSYMYRKAFMDYNVGYASAIAIAMIVIGLSLTGVLRAAANRIQGE